MSISIWSIWTLSFGACAFPSSSSAAPTSTNSALGNSLTKSFAKGIEPPTPMYAVSFSQIELKLLTNFFVNGLLGSATTPEP